MDTFESRYLDSLNNKLLKKVNGEFLGKSVLREKKFTPFKIPALVNVHLKKLERSRTVKQLKKSGGGEEEKKENFVGEDNREGYININDILNNSAGQFTREKSKKFSSYNEEEKTRMLEEFCIKYYNDINRAKQIFNYLDKKVLKPNDIIVKNDNIVRINNIS